MGFWKRWFGRQDTIRGRAFVLEDGQGITRAALRMDGVGNTVFSFHEADGTTRMFLGLTPEGTPRISMSYGGGAGSIQMEANDKLNMASVILTAPTGQIRLVLAIAQNNEPAFALLDKDGRMLFPQRIVESAGMEFPQDGSGDWTAYFHG